MRAEPWQSEGAASQAADGIHGLLEPFFSGHEVELFTSKDPNLCEEEHDERGACKRSTHSQDLTYKDGKEVTSQLPGAKL